MGRPNAAGAPRRRVAILLSTRDGAPFLAEQLESLLAQSHRDWQIFWRDDGSVDETPALMRDFADGAGIGRVVDLNDNAGHVGITASFWGCCGVRRAVGLWHLPIRTMFGCRRSWRAEWRRWRIFRRMCRGFTVPGSAW